MDTVFVTLSLTMNETLKQLSSLPTCIKMGSDESHFNAGVVLVVTV